VKDPAIRLAAWTAVLLGSLAIPAMMAGLPGVPVATPLAAVPAVATPISESAVVAPQTAAIPRSKFDWARTAAGFYLAVAAVLLLRLGFGLAMSLRLLRSSRATGEARDGIEIRESYRVTAPVTLGIVRPAIVVPGDWREWSAAKLEAVVAHELSHVRRFDPAVQLLSAIHRVLLWHSPLSWFLHQRIVRVAEEASDDAAVAAVRDRALYARVLLDFMQCGVRGAMSHGVPMARYGQPEKRIQRILSATSLSRGVGRWGLAAILAIASPVAYMVAAAHPRSSAPVEMAALPSPTAPETAIEAPPAVIAAPAADAAYTSWLGSVTASSTVVIRPRVDGQLMSVNFKEGELVRAGQLLASLDASAYQIQMAQAEGQVERDIAELADFKAFNQNTLPKQDFDFKVAQFEGRIKTDMAKVQDAKLQLSYTQVTSPISGIAGLRLVDPGNIVHASDTTGIVIVNQLQPIAVVFQVPQEQLPAIRAQLSRGATPAVEAWNRDNSAKIATGRLTAVDNLIDQTTGTVKLKAVFENRDGALFPNQFVNVRLFR
jgi:RND family efflux transporter MFP subunit